MTLTLTIPADKVRLLVRKLQAYTLAFGKTFNFSVHMQSNASYRFRDDVGFFDVTTSVAAGPQDKTSHMRIIVNVPGANEAHIAKETQALKGKALTLLSAFHQIVLQEAEKYGFEVKYEPTLSIFVGAHVSSKWGNWALEQIERKYPQEGFNPFALRLGGHPAPTKATYRVQHVTNSSGEQSFAGGTLGSNLSLDPT